MEFDEAVSLNRQTVGIRDQLAESIRESAKLIVATLGYSALAMVRAGANDSKRSLEDGRKLRYSKDPTGVSLAVVSQRAP